MEKIYELISLVRTYKDTLFTLIPKGEKSPLRKLSIIAFSKVQLTDEECMYKIYEKANVRAFSALKVRLNNKLIEVLILTQDVELKEEAAAQYSENLKTILAGIIIMSKGSIDIGLRMLEKSIGIAIKKNFTENVIIASKRLISGFGSERYNKYKYSKYFEIQTKYIDIYLWELKAQNYYFNLQKYEINSLLIPTNEFINNLIAFIKELDDAQNIQSPIFIYNKFRLKAMYFEYTKDYKNLLYHSNQAIQDFNKPNFKLSKIVANVYIRKILALIQLKMINEAIEFGNSNIHKINSMSNSWFRMNYYIIKAYLYNYNYLGAKKIIIKTFNNPVYKKISPNITEAFSTTFGYIHLLIISSYTSEAQNLKKYLPEFKLGRYLNSVPVYSKDKRGINISILLLHIAFLLQRKDYNAIIDRTDSLNQYAYRYLRRDDSFRSNCMIKMVIQMTKADFNPVRTERYTADLLKQLKSVKLAGSGENIEIEVIPFEVLWEIMLKSLKD